MALVLKKDGNELVVETAHDLEVALGAGWEHPDSPTGGDAPVASAGTETAPAGGDVDERLAESQATITRLEQEIDDASSQGDRAAAALKKARDETKAEKKRVETLERERDGLRSEVEQLNNKLAAAIEAGDGTKTDGAKASENAKG